METRLYVFKKGDEFGTTGIPYTFSESYDDNNVVGVPEHLAGFLAYLPDKEANAGTCAEIIDRGYRAVKNYAGNKKLLVKNIHPEHTVLCLLYRGCVRIRREDIPVLKAAIEMHCMECRLVHPHISLELLMHILMTAEADPDVEYIALQNEKIEELLIPLGISYPDFDSPTLEQFDDMDWAFDVVKDPANLEYCYVEWKQKMQKLNESSNEQHY